MSESLEHGVGSLDGVRRLSARLESVLVRFRRLQRRVTVVNRVIQDMSIVVQRSAVVLRGVAAQLRERMGGDLRKRVAAVHVVMSTALRVGVTVVCSFDARKKRRKLSVLGRVLKVIYDVLSVLRNVMGGLGALGLLFPRAAKQVLGAVDVVRARGGQIIRSGAVRVGRAARRGVGGVRSVGRSVALGGVFALNVVRALSVKILMGLRFVTARIARLFRLPGVRRMLSWLPRLLGPVLAGLRVVGIALVALGGPVLGGIVLAVAGITTVVSVLLRRWGEVKDFVSRPFAAVSSGVQALRSRVPLWLGGRANEKSDDTDDKDDAGAADGDGALDMCEVLARKSERVMQRSVFYRVSSERRSVQADSAEVTVNFQNMPKGVVVEHQPLAGRGLNINQGYSMH